jgi:hypothetical protein
MDAVLSDLDYPTAANGLLDDLIVPPYTAATSARFYWRQNSPGTLFEELGKATVGFPAAIPFEGKGQIRISMVGIAANGVPSTYDPREGVQTVFDIPSELDNIVTYGGDVVIYNGELVTYG